jgi:hypothetical protein
VVRNKKEYMTNMYKDHLNTKAYKRLTKEEAAGLNQRTRAKIKTIMNKGCGTNKAVLKYFMRSIQRPMRYV